MLHLLLLSDDNFGCGYLILCPNTSPKSNVTNQQEQYCYFGWRQLHLVSYHTHHNQEDTETSNIFAELLTR